MPTRRSLLEIACCLGSAQLLSATSALAQSGPAPTHLISGVSSRGERVTLKALRGSVVLVFVWSARCPVCLDKLPELRRNLDGWLNKPFVILAVNQDRTADDMRSYERLLEQMAPARSQLKHLWRGAPEHQDSFGELPMNMPTTMIFDKEGALSKTVRGRVSPELWDDVAELVLG